MKWIRTAKRKTTEYKAVGRGGVWYIVERGAVDSPWCVSKFDNVGGRTRIGTNFDREAAQSLAQQAEQVTALRLPVDRRASDA